MKKKNTFTPNSKHVSMVAAVDCRWQSIIIPKIVERSNTEWRFYMKLREEKPTEKVEMFHGYRVETYIHVNDR